MIGSEEVVNCKVVFLGNAGVGKTSIVEKWMHGSFLERMRPTIGANYQQKVMNVHNKKVDVFVWDTAGQEQYHSLAPLYTRSASAAIITAALSDEDSIDAITMWISLIHESCNSIPPIILALNKKDLVTIDEADVLLKMRTLFKGEFCGITFCSAFSGEGIDYLILLYLKV